MKTKLKLFLLMLMPVLMTGLVCVASPVMAANEDVDTNTTKIETNLFGTVTDDGNGCGVYTVLNLILTVLTFGVGIAATVGLVIAAITYLTAADDTGKITKAKTRIFEIVIGFLVYAMMWAALNWLLPGGLLNTGSAC